MPPRQPESVAHAALARSVRHAEVAKIRHVRFGRRRPGRQRSEPEGSNRISPHEALGRVRAMSVPRRVGLRRTCFIDTTKGGGTRSIPSAHRIFKTQNVTDRGANDGTPVITVTKTLSLPKAAVGSEIGRTGCRRWLRARLIAGALASADERA